MMHDEKVGKGASFLVSVTAESTLMYLELLRIHHFITDSSVSCPMELPQMNLHMKKKVHCFIQSNP